MKISDMPPGTGMPDLQIEGSRGDDGFYGRNGYLRSNASAPLLTHAKRVTDSDD